MNDFFQSLSFHGARKPAVLPTRASAAMHCIMQSFDEIPFSAYRPAPAAPRRSPKRSGKSSVVNHKS